MMSNRETTDDGRCSVVYILYMSIMHQHRPMSDRSGDGEGAGDLRRRRAAGSGGWQRGWPLEEVGRGGTWRGQASREQAVQANQACQALACACHQPALGTSTWAGRQGKTAEKAGRAVDCCGLKRITSQVWSGWRRHGTLELWKAKANSTAHRPCTNRLYTGASHARPCVHACPGTKLLEHVPGCY